MFLVTTNTILFLLLAHFQWGSSYTIIVSDFINGTQSGSITSDTAARTHPNEQEAVYDIMRATGNEWVVGIQDVCHERWHGIECMPDKDNIFHVVSLSFGALSVDTAFPTCDPTRSFLSPSITKLPHLLTLFMYRCFSDKSQPIPSFLGQLGSSLQTLVLRDNGHIGPIPHELGNLTRLKVLNLRSNNLNGSIPVSLGRITSLRSLDLSCNRLTGRIPNISFSPLHLLDLNQNHLKGPLPTSLLAIRSLMKMDLSRNQLSGPIPNTGMENLILLDLSYNALTTPLPESLENLKSLQVLILSNNPSLSGTIPNNMFEGLSNLMILVLSDMRLEGSIPESLGYLTKLRVLHLDGNQLNGTIPQSFANLKGISEVKLNGNKLRGPIPFGREKVWEMGRKLRLDNNLGLCYDKRSGLGDDSDTMLRAGVRPCSEPKSRPVQHINDGEIFEISEKSSRGKKITISRGIMFLSYLLIIFYV